MSERQSLRDEQTYSIIFYDGVCSFCQRVVQFILPRDMEGRFRFVAIQSNLGKKVLKQHGLDPEELTTFVLLEQGKMYTRSTAGLRVLRGLGGLWPLLYAFIAVPRPLRDAVYRVIANNRYRIFGRTDSCILLKPHEKARFLE